MQVEDGRRQQAYDDVAAHVHARAQRLREKALNQGSAAAPVNEIGNRQRGRKRCDDQNGEPSEGVSEKRQGPDGSVAASHTSPVYRDSGRAPAFGARPFRKDQFSLIVCWMGRLGSLVHSAMEPSYISVFLLPTISLAANQPSEAQWPVLQKEICSAFTSTPA